MKLHQDKNTFEQSVRAASQHLSIPERFIEKDYWISHVLSQLAESEHANKLVFKGGTSLSKAYGLIDRFSEDVDLAVLGVESMSSNQTKKLISKVEKEITKDLAEVTDSPFLSKGSRYRKSLHAYDSSINSKDNRLIVEISSFANPFPYEKMSIQSMIGLFMEQSSMPEFIEKHRLKSFEINVLSKMQTMLEKIVSLIRFSFDDKHVAALSEKIRHFYDLHFLSADPECMLFLRDKSFKKKLHDLLEYDKAAFDEPQNWGSKNLSESPLIIDFENLWNNLKNKYETELSEYAYRQIPNSEQVYKSLKAIIALINKQPPPPQN